eukprot:TRINITY_DN6134_c0_g1_i1.p1 TRINITY_DN6134_c0_g1~~TRINITY_DN6134_c0_g1_i1.p1  ORF type:complete len:594 (+),score=66.01 TRINITY_DN6134_c0_g1_i1:106-1887(+)
MSRMKAAVLLLVFLFAAFSLADDELVPVERTCCPDDCSFHGSCLQNCQCQCYSSFLGIDCSIWSQTMTSGQIYYGTVSHFEWVFYQIYVPNPSHTLVFAVNETSTGDCDEYVLLQNTPTRSQYSVRDLSGKKSVTLTITNATVGHWNLGIYGFSGCSFVVAGSIEGNCPNGCSNHGSCINSRCVCNQNYGGDDCSYWVSSLVEGSYSYGTAVPGAWSYFSYRYTATSNVTQLRFNVTEDQTNTCTYVLYAKYGSLPTSTSWDYIDYFSWATNKTEILIDFPSPGIWYVGVMGSVGSDCQFWVGVERVQDASCPNNCSLRGVCQNHYCICPTGEYTGTYCQYKFKKLVDGETVAGYAAPGQWNYFRFLSNTDEDLAIFVMQKENDLQADDCGLYVLDGTSYPNTTYYDYVILPNNNFYMTIPDPGFQYFGIGVYGFNTCVFNITVFQGLYCQNNCSNHGTCNGGVCVCDQGWSGDDCSSNLGVLELGEEINGTIGWNSWNYYSFAVNGSTFYVILKEFSTTGTLWLYVNDISAGNPTITNYLYSSLQTNTGFHLIEVDLNSPVTQTYIVGVYGNPNLAQGESADYELVAWSANI